jgi:hypothetical protein
MATVLEMFFTLESESDLRAASAKGNRRLICYALLPNGEAFAVTTRHATWVNEDFGMPASHHQKSDWIFSSQDAQKTSRPIRLTRWIPPKDGEALIASEFGGYAMPAGTWKGASLNRGVVSDHGPR